MVRSSDGSRNWIAAAAFALVALLSACGDDGGEESSGDDGESTTATVRLIGADDPGPDPFFESVASVDVDEAVDFADDRRERPAGEAGEAGAREEENGDELAVREMSGGTSADLYGSSSEAVCDRVALVERLQSDPQRAESWADAAGVDSADMDEITEFVESLAPVVLANDVAVTNHAWSSGTADAFQSVLQGGTAVMVDDRGIPRVQCACGNPLREADLPDDEEVALEGERWDGFGSAELTTVAPADEPLTELGTVDISTGEQVSVPVGGERGSEPDDEADGELVDGMLEYGVHGLRLLGDDGQVVSLVARPVELAAPDGDGGVVFAYQTDTPFEAPPEDMAIWHLPAGADEPVMLLDVAPMSSRAPAVHGMIEHAGRSLFAFEVFEGGAMDDRIQGDLHVLDMDTGEVELVAENTSGYESGISSVTADSDVMTWIGAGEGFKWMEAADSDLNPLEPPPWDPLPEDDGSAPCMEDGALCASAIELLGDGEALMAETSFAPGGGPTLARLARVTTDGSGDEAWATDVDLPGSGSSVTRLQVVDGRGLLKGEPPTPHMPPDWATPNVLFDVETGEIIETLDLEGVGVLLDGPLRLPSEAGASD